MSTAVGTDAGFQLPAVAQVALVVPFQVVLAAWANAGKTKRQTMNLETRNIQHPTSNIQHPINIPSPLPSPIRW
jgi:hypothetical protein